jgi:murein DD-endopeptidase MepM/ murein hydrolase activator NlpD
VTAGWNGGGYGYYVIIDHGNGFKTLYGHLLNNSMVVKAGQVVSQGQKLGNMGSTGRSTGTHLHFEIIGPNGKVDPLSKLR